MLKNLIGCWRISTNQKMVEWAAMESKTDGTYHVKEHKNCPRNSVEQKSVESDPAFCLLPPITKTNSSINSKYKRLIPLIVFDLQWKRRIFCSQTIKFLKSLSNQTIKVWPNLKQHRLFMIRLLIKRTACSSILSLRYFSNFKTYKWRYLRSLILESVHLILIWQLFHNCSRNARSILK